MTPEFKPFPKMARLSRDVIITEKIDGTNASILIMPLEGNDAPPNEAIDYFWVGDTGFALLAASRTRWITPESDNFGFAAWVKAHAEELQLLGPGHHFGEWWGRGIQRGYGVEDKRFSLFNAVRWCEATDAPFMTGESWDPVAKAMVPRFQQNAPACCFVVPVLYCGEFLTERVDFELECLRGGGSKAAPGFMSPEGVVVYHMAGNVGFKKTIDGDKAKGDTTA